VRWQGQKTFRASNRQAWQGELPPPTGIGNLASGQWRWGSSLDSIDFSPSGWLIRGVRASISVDSVGFKSNVSSKGFGLNVECHDLRLEFTPGDVALPIPAPMTFQVVADGGRLRALGHVGHVAGDCGDRDHHGSLANCFAGSDRGSGIDCG
jgi:hypothetical protein